MINRFISILLRLLFISIICPNVALAEWDKSGHYRLRDTTIQSKPKLASYELNSRNTTKLYFEQSLFGVLFGLGGGIVGGLAGALLFELYGAQPGAILGYVAANSYGVYLGGKINNSKGSYPVILLSETIGMSLVFSTSFLCDYAYKSQFPNNNNAYRFNEYLTRFTFSMSIALPTVFGIMGNEKTLKTRK